MVKDKKGTENQVVDHLCKLEDEAFLKLGYKAELIMYLQINIY